MNGILNRRGFVILVALGSVTFLFGLSSPGLYDPHEGLYAEISREMLILGDWITPHFNFVPYLEKPPLLYWLVALSYSVLGVSEFTARLPVALAGLAGVLVTFLLAKELFGARAAFLSGVVLATSFGYFIFSRSLMTDIPFTAFLVLAVLFFVRGYKRPGEGNRHYLLSCVAAGLAVMTKGLIGIVFPLLIITAFILVTREFELIHEIRPIRMALILLGVTVPWHLLVATRNDGFLWFYFVNEHVLRFFNKRHLIDYAAMPILPFLAMTLIWFFPWSFFLPWGWRQLVPRRVADLPRERRVPLLIPIWVGAILLFFSLTPARLEYYSLPALPALAIWVGSFWDNAITTWNKRERVPRSLLYPVVLLFAVTLLLVPLSFSFPKLAGTGSYNMFQAFDTPSGGIQSELSGAAGPSPVSSFKALISTLAFASSLLLVGMGAALVGLLRKRPWLTFCGISASMLCVFTLIHQALVLFEPQRSIKELGLAIKNSVGPGDVIVTEGSHEDFAGVNFYTGRFSYVLNGRFGDLQFGSQYIDENSIFIDEKKLQELWTSGTRVFLLSRSPARYEKLKDIPSHSPYILERTGGTWLFANHR